MKGTTSVKLTLEFPDPVPPQVLSAIAELLAKVGAEAAVTVDDEGWNVDRAHLLLRAVNSRARQLLEAAVEGDGWLDGPAFRARYGERAFYGPSQTITKAIKRGAEQGLWPVDITPPLRPTTPGPEGWAKTGGYHLASGLLPIFREAFERLQQKSEPRRG
ncbi:hypothetical protein [Streptomyces sp. NPDC096033]|uniref:hypothetical protein n=1 Tax=Streptomyces sp. NPDC096033 TaxID=3366071 RepID=UPI00382CD6FE